MIDTILLKCPACPAQKEVARIPGDPSEAVAISLHCDRHQSAPADVAPKYLDADGRHIARDSESRQ